MSPLVTGDIIADTGHPHFPGWQAIAALLMGVTVCAQLAGTPGLRGGRVTARPVITRLIGGRP